MATRIMTRILQSLFKYAKWGFFAIAGSIPTKLTEYCDEYDPVITWKSKTGFCGMLDLITKDRPTVSNK